jgi:hypothetical protein
MNQIFHIFRKDVRHHWIVILLCQAALAMYCWDEVQSWSERTFGLGGLSSFIRLLLPLTWCFFILRMVQDESLVGDRQFWVTRPYEWKKLLAEKILMVLVFLSLPLLIAGVILLAKAGFSPAPHFLGLLWMQCLLFQLPFLPLLALGAVTRNPVQGLVTLVAVLMLMVGIAVFPLFLRTGDAFFAVNVGWTGSFPGSSNNLDDLVLLIVCVAAIGLQYARRKTAQSRLWLVGGVLGTVVIGLVTAYAKRNRDPYPVPERQTIAFHAGLDPVKLLPPKAPAQKDEAVPIGIPVSASGIPQSSLGWNRGMRVVLEGPRGLRWDGRWPGSIQLLGPGESRWRAVFEMDYKTYERLKSVPLKAYVSLSVDVFAEHESKTVKASDAEFDVPGVGRCRPWGRDQHTLRCNSPLVQPAMVVVRFDPALSTCPEQDTSLAKPVYGLPYAWQWGRESRLAEGGVSPVAASLFYFWAFNDRVQICPETPLNFSFPQFTENVRVDFEIDNLNLDDYRQANFESGSITGADGIRLGLAPLPR